VFQVVVTYCSIAVLTLYAYLDAFFPIFRYSQTCSHVGAVLFCLSDLIACGLTDRPEDPSCTDVLCKWTDPKGIYTRI
jgi:hypothetical protein